MSQRYLDHLFNPESVAVIGASNRPGSVGRTVLRNLLEGSFAGPILPVNPKDRAVAGVLAYPSIDALPFPPDMAILCTRPATIPALVDGLGSLGTRAAIVVTAGLERSRDDTGRTLAQVTLDHARRHGIRLLGPNCLGLIVPGLGLNASFAHAGAAAGGIAFVSQSGGLCTAVLDWANSRGTGFSTFVSLGDQLDVDFADVIDWLAQRRETRALLLYIESIHDPRKFLSAARAASRVLPIVAIKSGRSAAGARAAASHTGALAGRDDVYDAALRRAGVLRVDRTEELFDAVETLSRARNLTGERLAILTNSGGPAVMATDHLERGRGRLAQLSEETVAALEPVLPPTWSRCNPVDIIGDADGDRYRAAMGVLMQATEVDALLVMHAPTAIAESSGAAAAVAEAAGSSRKMVLTAWLGGSSAQAARKLFDGAGIASYQTPEAAVDAFLYTVRHRRSQASLQQTPPSVPEQMAPDREEARALLERAIGEGRSALTEPEAKQLLAAYRIPILETRLARDAEEAARAADAVGFPVALKVFAPAVSHKTDVGGVELGLGSVDEVRAAAARIAERLERARPGTALAGYLVQPMVQRRDAVETIAGIATDPLFGPVVLFGQGGIAVEVVGDSAVALPPLDLPLALDLIAQTRVARLLEGYRNRPPADTAALASVLVQLAQMAIDLRQLAELDINPLLVDHHGVLAIDARVRLDVGALPAAERLAIRPYPRELEEEIETPDGLRVLLRPIRPADEPAHARLLAALDPESVYFRFFSVVREMPHERLARYTQIDYDREMAFIATREVAGEAQTLGVSRAIFDGARREAEFALVIDPAYQGRGLGRILLEKTIRYCRAQGAQTLVGQVLAENRRMRRLASDLGFRAGAIEAGVVEVKLDL